MSGAFFIPHILTMHHMLSIILPVFKGGVVMALIHRHQWVDLIKIFACVLVALGHFFQGMIPSGIYPSTGFFRWFEQTIYYFHVPLFLICSGYLFQHNSRIDSPQAWLQNIKNKLLSLGIPYITFSFATWMLKVLFSDSVNSQAGNLLETLFLAPVGQMWYLYCLIFIFFCTITLNSKKSRFFTLLHLSY